MRLKSVTIENFRCYATATIIDFDDLTMIVGRNDAGKSAILEALAIFFDEAKLESGDCCVGTPTGEVNITCTFTDLPSSVVLDAAAPTTLLAEHLLDSAGHLAIRKKYNGALATPKLLGVYAVANHPKAAGFDDLLTKKNPELKSYATQLGLALTGVNKNFNTELRAAIWASCPNLALGTSEGVLDKANCNNIWKDLEHYLPSFALFKSDRASTDQDAEAQEPLKIAIKEALAAKQPQLNALAAYVENEVKKVADATLAKLQEMDATLASDLAPVFNKPSWQGAFKVSLTDDTQVPDNKRGSGVRHLILLNFFRAKAEQDAAQAERPGTIYAVEEPETSQHPSNQLLLLSAFQDIAAQSGNQVLLTSHTPVLARRLDVNQLRYVEIVGPTQRVIHGPSAATNAMIAKALGVLPDHDVRVFVGVEGKHDIEYLRRISAILHAAGEPLPDLGVEEDRGRLVFVPLGGSNLSLWVSRLAPLDRPEVHIFDRDVPPPDPPKYQTEAAAINSQANSDAFITSHRELENYIAPAAIAAARPHLPALPLLGPFVDVPQIVAELEYNAGAPTTPWGVLSAKSRKRKEGHVKIWLNRDAVNQMTPTMLTSVDPNDDVRTWISKIAQHL